MLLVFVWFLICLLGNITGSHGAVGSGVVFFCYIFSFHRSRQQLVIMGLHSASNPALVD